MSWLDILLLILIAGLCGAIGQEISGSYRGGLLTSIALGFIGAILGVGLARSFNLPELLVITINSTNFPIVWSIIGAALFMAVIGLFTRRYSRW